MPDHVPPRDGSPRLPRRRFLLASALMAGGAIASPVRGLAAGVAPEHVQEWLSLLQSATPAAETYTPVALTADEIATLKAAVGRIIPTDDLGPGADEAGAHIYIDRSLKGPNAALLSMYQTGLGALGKAGGATFDTLGAAKQDQLLTELEGGKLSGAPEGFFPLLLEHTRQGMFSDPIYGGNRNFAGWDLIGYPGIKLSWSAAEQQIDATVKPEHISVKQYGGQGW